MFAIFEIRRKNKPLRALRTWTEQNIGKVGKRFIFLQTELRFCFRVKDLLRLLNEMCEQFEKLQQQRKKLDKTQRGDPIFERMESVFLVSCTQLVQTLDMCAWERLKEVEYPPRNMLQALIARNKAVLHNYGDYLFALTQATFRDTLQDRETIARTVQAMSEVMQQHGNIT